MRDVAKAVGCSMYAVSSALNNRGRISTAVRSRIVEESRRLGYRLNPYISAAMASARGGKVKSEIGTIAIISLSMQDQIESQMRRQFEVYYDSMLEGARRRADELGFKTETVWLDKMGISLDRLNNVLQARGIQGVVMLPNCRYRDFSNFPWEAYSPVQLFPTHSSPRLHRASVDFHRGVHCAVDELQRRGYQRPGFFVEEFRDELVEKRWSSAFLAVLMRLAKINRVPVFIKKQIEAKKFLKWYEAHHPDVLIGHCHDAITWLEEAGYKMPGDFGFFSLNRLLTGEDCSGLDHRPNEIGALGIDMVVGQIYRNERGIPSVPRTVLIDADYVDGSSLAHPVHVTPSYTTA